MSCLPACAKMLLGFIGNPIEEAALRELLKMEETSGMLRLFMVLTKDTFSSTILILTRQNFQLRSMHF
jgi:hypothetical protein